MTWAQVVETFLAKIRVIYNLKPAYKQPGDGSDGTCDCIGMIIGAIRRMGLKWTGIHGSNWAARKEVDELKKIGSVNDLELGDIVFKGYAAGDSKNTLPARYKKGGSYYNGDLTDYYHVGTVTQLNPLRITHMTSPTAMIDTKLGKWAYHGRVKILLNAASGDVPTVTPTPEPEPTTEPTTTTPTSGSKAIVVADNGKPVKMRQYPSTGCRTWEAVPCGTEVEIVAPGEDWAQISYGRRQGWYMMAKLLDIVGDGKGKY